MGKRELLHAVKSRNQQVVKEIIMEDNSLLYEPIIGKSLLNYAAEYGDISISELVVEFGLSVNFCEGCEPPLYTAVNKADMAMVEWLLSKGADPNIKSGTKPLIYSAIYAGNPEIVKLLVAKNIDVLSSWERFPTPLRYACEINVWPKEVIEEIGLAMGYEREEIQEMISVSMTWSNRFVHTS
ncbi:four ankyrin repeats protein [Oleiphilus messinensis]|uniref:Four ankyrin repeats protein n=1 Tax=Oleiphilus messinensis TaxID=141451 RepID=A0A1Y0I2F8_9GAMM|nr:ankyrin repeat domain-containing protein [Oleiphilus messinensis]ARU54657.1 four ankyrin repeats protein [Oleiphilus messinensis]